MLHHYHLWRSTSLCRSVVAPSAAHYTSSALEWLTKFTNFEQKGVPSAAGTDTDDGFDLGRMHSLLESLGAPHSHWPAIHVAGTKGKGSTVSMISSILKASGYKVGSYTSPHITSLHERISVNSQPIPGPVFDDLVSRYAALIESQHAQHEGKLTHFEILTALAFKHFQEQAVDVAVVETGLGGVRDATNVFTSEGLIAAVITALGNDHAAALGGSMQSIAAAKAGIMKPHRPTVLAPQLYPEAEQVLIEHAHKLQCEVLHVSQQLKLTSTGGAWLATDKINSTANRGVYRQQAYLELETPLLHSLLSNKGQTQQMDKTSEQEQIVINLRMLGNHQLDNAATALTAAAVAKQHSGLSNISLQSCIEGLESAQIPGRFQICRFRSTLDGSPSTNLMDSEEAAGSTSDSLATADGENESNDMLVVLDGAHTPESAAALVKTFQTTFLTPHPTDPADVVSSDRVPLALVVAMADDKPHREVCAALRKLLPDVVVFTQVSVAGGSTRAAAPGALAGAWQAAGMLDPSSRAKGRRTRELIQASLTSAVEKAKMELRGHGVKKGSGKKGVVVVTGSLHAVAAALQNLDLEPM